MKHLSYSLIGGLGLLSLQSCASKQQIAEQEYPNVIYVFPDQYRNMAMGFWHEKGFKEHIHFAADPVYTPHIDSFAKESSGTFFCHEQLPAEQSAQRLSANWHVSQQKWNTSEL